MKRFFTYLIMSLFVLSQVYAQSFTCNNALVGQDYVVDRVSPSILSVLGSGNSFNNVLDGDLTNFAQVDMTLVALGSSVVSVKKVNGSFAAGQKVGFVIEVPSTLLTVDLLEGLSLRTYLNNTVQETVALTTGGGLLKLSVLNSGEEGTKRIEFTTSAAFDEIELVQSSAVAALTTLNIYNAYLSDASCNNDCITTLTTSNYSGASVSTATGFLVPKFSNTGNLLDASLTNYSTQPDLLGIGLGSFVQVNSGTTFPIGTDVGFRIQQAGLLGLVNLNLLGSLEIRTYNSSGVVQETFTASDLADVSLLSDGYANIGFKTTKAFSNVRLTSTALLDLDPIRVYYAYVRLDDDNDGVPNCLDNCVGNDLLVNSNGEPLACYPECDLNAGADISECPANSDGSIQLASAGSASWEPVAGNPSAATINSSGLVQNMSVEGIYKFRLYNAVCSDTISVNYQAGNNTGCNRALVGPNIIVDGEDLQGGALCLLCGGSGGDSVVDGDLSNYLEYDQLLNLLLPTSLIAVRDTNNVYPAGTRTGFVVSFPDGLLSTALLNQFEIKTYLNGTFVESATTSNSLLGAGVIVGAGNKTRIGFVTTQAFDKVEIALGNVLGLLTTIRVHNAFVEDGSCSTFSDASTNPESSCFEILKSNSDNFSTINYDRTGYTGVACALCNTDSLSNIVDNSYTNFSTLTLPVGALVKGSVSVLSKKTFTSGYEAGFAVLADSSILTTDVLSNIAIVTYLDGVKQDSIDGSTGLIKAALIPGAVSLGYLGFRSTKSFNEVKLVVTAPVGANLLSSGLKIYYAYARLDTDGDGTPDCLDKCCSGSDDLDSDGDGIPDNCDVDILAVADTVTTIENSPITIDVLDNDELGINGFDSISITQQPSNGTVEINDGGTPNDPSDDIITYTPDSNTYGVDTFYYQICDTFTICSEAMVIVEVEELLKVKDDSVTIDEDAPTTIDVLDNDTFGAEGPSDGTITIQTPPVNGTAVVDDNGTPDDPSDDAITYTPNPNFSGTDSLVYEICDAENTCDSAVVYITVDPINDAPVVTNDTTTTSGNLPIIIPVLVNDNDTADGVSGGLDTTSLTVVTPPTNGTISVDTTTGEITYTPDPGYSGIDSFVYEICDLGEPLPAQCGQGTVYVDVTPVLDAQNDSTTINEDSPTTIDVLDNDSFGLDGPASGPITILTPASNGTSTVDDNGTPNDPTDDVINYTPNPNFNGTDSIVYEICDANSTCESATVYITVDPINDAPVVIDDSTTTSINTPVTVPVLVNDNDTADGMNGGLDSSSLTIINQPTNGTLSVNTSTGEVTYTPDNGYEGIDSFVYEICDLGNPLPAQCGQATVYVEITSVLVAQNDSTTINEDSPTTIDVLDNDSFGSEGPSNGPITIVTPPVNGTATVDDNGTPTDPTDDVINYTPNPNFNGTDSLVYQICDANSTCESATVYITVDPINDAPVAVNDSGNTSVNTPVLIPVLVNDNDTADGVNGGLDTSSLTIITQPINGTLSVNTSTGEVTYTPNSGFEGNDSFVYEICDSGSPLPAQCSQATVAVTVEDITPVAVDDSYTGEICGAATVNVINNDVGGSNVDPTTVSLSAPVGATDIVTDADGDTIWMTIPGEGTWTVNPTTGTIMFIPLPSFTGSPTPATYIVNDNSGNPSNPAVVTITNNVVVYPDLSPNITFFPGTILGPSNFDVLIEIKELENLPTDGSMITVTIPKNATLPLNFDPNQSILLFFPVDNQMWTYDGTDVTNHIFTTNETIPANGTLSFSLSSQYDPNSINGFIPISATVVSGGGEVYKVNNTDTESLKFFTD